MHMQCDHARTCVTTIARSALFAADKKAFVPGFLALSSSVAMSVFIGSSAPSSPYFGFGRHTSLCSALPDSKYTLIVFLGAAQLLSVDFLPITWNSALNDAGVGGTATLRERLISQNLSLLFKRVHPRHFPQYEAKIAEGIVFRTLVSELETARHYDVVKSSFLAHLEGVSWDIEPNGEVWPVLVYEKAKYGSVRTVMESSHMLGSITLDLVTRLQICLHIAKGLNTLHRNGDYDLYEIHFGNANA